MKPGQHIACGSEPATRVALTVLQAMGLGAESFGTRSMATSSPLGAVLS